MCEHWCVLVLSLHLASFYLQGDHASHCTVPLLLTSVGNTNGCTLLSNTIVVALTDMARATPLVLPVS